MESAIIMKLLPGSNGFKKKSMEKNTQSEALWRIFEEQRVEAEAVKDRWFHWFVGNVVVLFVLAVLVFFGLVTGTGFAAASWLEFAVAIPLVYSAIFFHAQHARAREYLEEYSFKSLVARSLEDCRAFLREDADRTKPDEQKKYLDFMIGVMHTLYTSPREAISKLPVKDEEDVKVGVVEKLGDVFKKFIPGM